MNCVVLFARAPSAPGKTRLTDHLTSDRARELREALLLDTLDAVRGTADLLCVAFTPQDARDELATLLGSIDLIAQRGSDLGERMRNAMCDAVDLGAESVVLLGSDLPTLPGERVADAFRRLDADADVVFGPSVDGGFYLVGARRPASLVFDGVEWGTDHVLAETIAAVQRKSLYVAQVEPWWDVDVPDDLRRVLRDGRLTSAPRVRRWLLDHFEELDVP